ncbi:MAG: transpeptidase family protein [Bacteroidales bacterium]|nr:transpeptidase family protein [Bacteroidales bacterium]
MNKKSLKTENKQGEGSLTIRVFVVYLLIVLAGLGIFYRIGNLQIFHKDDLRARLEAHKATIKPMDIPVERGVILSRHDEILVERLPIYNIHIDTYPTEQLSDGTKIINMSDSVFNINVAALGDSLTALFGATTPSWEQRLRAARAEQKHFVKISDKASIKDYERIKKFPIFYDAKKGHNPYNALCRVAPNLDNVVYPFGNLAKRTLGVAKKSNDTLRKQNDNDRELTGLVGYYDEELSGTPGRLLKKYIGGIPFDIASPDNIYPRDGVDITTTLNMTMQYIANEALLNAVIRSQAKKGCVIVMEVATGDILAMANLSHIGNGDYSDIKNHALDKYEPGSTFKAASLMVALEDGKVTTNTEILLNYKSGSKKSKVGERDVEDDHALKINNPALWEIFAQSSNVGTTRAIRDNYISNPQQFIDGLYKLGFGDTLHFPVVLGDQKPSLEGPKDKGKWSGQSISSIPMGYEVELTPLHLLTFYNAIANNGCMVQPRLITKIASKEETEYVKVDTLKAHICSEKTLRDMRGMLDSVVTRGTARNAFAKAPYSVAGKTGTAEDLTKENKGKGLYTASFCGYFPADNPKYACVVVIKEIPGTIIVNEKTVKNDHYGGSVAAPVFRNIADKIYATDFDLMPEANFAQTPEWKQIQSNAQRPKTKNVASTGNTVPDVKGMSLTDAVYILDKAGLATEIKGYGRVKKQSPEANAPLKKGEKVILELDIKG